MSAILGINAFHADSAACLVIDGKLVGAVAEERLGDREKHTSKFPQNAVRHLLKDNGISLSDVSHVALARDTSANRSAKMGWVARNPIKGARAILEHVSRNKQTFSMIDELSRICDEAPEKAKFQVVPVEHHFAHIASSYYLSPFESLTAGFSYDASGDFASAMAARCEGTTIDVLDRVLLPHSLGFFYTAMCQFIGFDSFGEEYKVMGLAPYGEDNYGSAMKELVRLPKDGWFQLAQEYFGMHQGGKSGKLDAAGQLSLDRLYTGKLLNLLGKPATRGIVTQREKDIARSTQVRFEEAALHSLNNLWKRVKTDQLVMAGGCALNGVANARILRETPFQTAYLQAASSDDGTCIGAAYAVWHNTLGQNDRFHMEHAFWGPEYSDARQKRAFAEAGLKPVVFESVEAAIPQVAKLIADGKVVGWYQGRSEWGPRALGNRSILANPSQPNMKELINKKIKRRESFRPFAPSVLREDVNTYFEQDVFSPFMMHVVKLRAEWRHRLPAITHVDGTGRLQSVDKASNQRYHALISEVKKSTGVGMVLNTSFNENEPVVDTPEQAINCYLRTDMDALCIGRYLVSKA